jgi:hypothetical protein
MWSFYEILIMSLLLLYIFFCYQTRNGIETFEGQDTNSHYKDASKYEDIYDDFYGFYYDDLFYQEAYYLGLCQVLLKYLNHVYNNHLCIGIKHRGHINELLKKNMKTTSLSQSQAIVNVCKYQYPDNVYQCIPEYEKNPFVFDENTFTHVSVIDNELYYIQNFPSFMYNCHKWLMMKGYLFLQCYHSKQDLKKGFLKIGENSSLRIQTVYSHEFKDFSESSSLSLCEVIKPPKRNKQRKNIHTLFFYQKEYIENVANEYNLEKIDTIALSPHECVLVFQKVG